MVLSFTEAQGISFVGYTEGEGSKPGVWNLQNLCPVPPQEKKPIPSAAETFSPVLNVEF